MLEREAKREKTLESAAREKRLKAQAQQKRPGSGAGRNGPGVEELVKNAEEEFWKIINEAKEAAGKQVKDLRVAPAREETSDV